MKIIAFVTPSQRDIIRKILEHLGIWEDAQSRSPPQLPFQQPTLLDVAPRRTVEVDPDFLEHCRREQTEQLELPLGS
jgi:hypothetical protein